jgi:Ca2+-binding RTX toxin-like protein
LGVGAALVVVAALTTNAVAGAFGSDGSGRAGLRAPAVLPAAYRRDASVDPLVAQRLARRGHVDVLLTLAGVSTLSSARISSGGDSRALLRTVVPEYRMMKAGLRARAPELRVLDDYRTLPVLFVRLGSRAELARLRADPSVVGIGADRREKASLTQSLPLIGQPAAAAAGFTGGGTAVAVLDSGLDYTRSAFGSCSSPGTPGCKVVVAQDFAPDDGMRDDPAAGLHGTNVSGIIAGVAPDVKLLGLDVFNGLSSSTSTQVAAINFVISRQATYNIRAINMSLGSPETFRTSPCTDPADARVAAFANARAAGIIPVVASGNDRFSNGSNHVGISRPACIPGALPVGAVYDGDNGGITWGGPNANDRCTDASTTADQITCFSQVWRNPMMLAPGAKITAAGITQGGTSQAAPHVAGGIAVLYDASPGSSISAVETALRSSGPLIADGLVGQSYRRLDLPASIAALGATTTTTTTTTTITPPPGTCTIDGTGSNDVLVGTPGDDVICGAGGNDILIIGAGGSDTVMGGGGFDFISMEDASGGVTVDLGAGAATAPGFSGSLQQIEGVIGSEFADHLTGNGADNDLLGLGGDDDLDGRGGFDFVRYDFATKPIRADLGRGTARGEGADVLAAFEGFRGGPKDDEGTGNGRSNVLLGSRGDDVLHGVGKPDELSGGPGADDLFGGGGNDDLSGGPGPDSCDVGPGGGRTSSC